MAPRAFSAAHLCDCACERMGLDSMRPLPASRVLPSRRCPSPARSLWLLRWNGEPVSREDNARLRMRRLSTRTLIVRSSPSTSFCSAPLL